MAQYLPTHGFKWENGEKFTPEKINELVKKDKRRYQLEVDMEYPIELHETDSKLPFLVAKMKIRREQKSIPNLKHKKKIFSTNQNTALSLKRWFKIEKGTPGH